MKTCTKCRSEKSLEFFSTSKENKDGKHSWCKHCVNAQRRLVGSKYKETRKKYEQLNKEKILNSDRKRRASESFKKKKSLWDKSYREKNSQSLKQKKSDYYSNNLQLRRAEYQRNTWRYRRDYYSALYGLEGFMPKDANKKKIQEFYELARKKSEETGLRYEVDHIIPVSKGGLHHENNLQILLWSENRTKRNKLFGALK